MNLNPRKFFLYLLIASVAISAVIGIVVVLFGNFGELEAKVLLTALTVVATSILGLACGAFLETRRGKYLPLSGIVFSFAAFVLWLVLIWSPGRDGQLFVKALLTVTLLAAACSLMSLVSLAVLQGKFIWSRYAAHLAVWTLSAILLLFIWTEYDLIPEGAMNRTLGVLAIAVAALTVITPVFHKLSQTTSEETKIDDEIARLKDRLAMLEDRKSRLHKQGAGE